MNISRRGFLGAMLAAAAAPAIVKTESLMRVVVPRPVLLTLWGDGVHDDAKALQDLISGKNVMFQGREFGPRADGSIHLPAGTFAMGAAAILASGTRLEGNGARLQALHKGPMLEAPRGTRDLCISNIHFIGLGEPAIRVQP